MAFCATLDGVAHEIPPVKITRLCPPHSETTKTEGVAEIEAFIDAKRNAAEAEREWAPSNLTSKCAGNRRSLCLYRY